MQPGCVPGHPPRQDRLGTRRRRPGVRPRSAGIHAQGAHDAVRGRTCRDQHAACPTQAGSTWSMAQPRGGAPSVAIGQLPGCQVEQGGHDRHCGARGRRATRRVEHDAGRRWVSGPDARLRSPQQERIERHAQGPQRTRRSAAATDDRRYAVRRLQLQGRVGAEPSQHDDELLPRQRLGRIAAQQRPEVGRGDGRPLRLLEESQVDDDPGAVRAIGRSARQVGQTRHQAPGAAGPFQTRASGRGRAARPSAAAARRRAPPR